MSNPNKDLLKEMSFEEKASLLTGSGNMSTKALDKYDIRELEFADGPHGLRLEDNDSTLFPNLCNVGCSWDVENIRLMGQHLADECIHNNIDVLLGPGINIKRHILCGRNFEYLSEDPVLAGKLAAGYIKGLQEKGVAACLKHFAACNQEKYRCDISVEVDERTLREVYLKAFEIAIKESNPASIMCAYNKVNSIYSSENEYLLSDVLRKEWGYEGIVVSDWGAVHDISRAVKAGLDMEMPMNENIVSDLQTGIEKGLVSMADIDKAVERMLHFVRSSEKQKNEYDRNKQHNIARKIAAEGIVLLKNENNVLPITKGKYKKIAVMGEYAISPLISGQGSAEVKPDKRYIDSPLEELKKCLPDTEFKYVELYKKREFPQEAMWPKWGAWMEETKDCDLYLFFAGTMESEDTESFDRRTAEINANQELFIDIAAKFGKKVVVVLQNGGVILLNEWHKKVDSIVDMWLAGEAGGGAIADVLCGIVNPSGKLAETFPNKLRVDMEYPGDGYKLEYSERFDVGYRYYDKHPEEIIYPFGYGLSYTDFEYTNLKINKTEHGVNISFELENTGNYYGAEVTQLYVGDPVSTAVKPIKELKLFKKVFLNPKESTTVIFELNNDDLAYYNIMQKRWIVEPGVYNIYISSSAIDTRLFGQILIEGDPYTLSKINEPMIG